SGSVAAAQGRGSPAAWRLPRIAGARAVSRLPGIAGARQHSGCPESRGPGSVRGGWPPTRAGSEAQPWPRRSGQNGANYGWPVSVAALGAAPTVVTGDSQVRRTWFYCAFCFTDYLPSEHDQQMGLVTASRTAGCTCIGNRSSTYIGHAAGPAGHLVLSPQVRCYAVPPVGVEPTLGTLLGGRPLPLGYGGWVIIPPPRGINSWRTEFGGIVSPGGYISNSDPFHE